MDCFPETVTSFIVQSKMKHSMDKIPPPSINPQCLTILTSESEVDCSHNEKNALIQTPRHNKHKSWYHCEGSAKFFTLCINLLKVLYE